MNAAAQYILSVTAAALLAAIARNLAGNGTMGALVKLLGGVFMALTVLSPMLHLELPDPGQWLHTYTAEGRTAAAEGEVLAKDAAHAIITGQVEAYILDKAAQCGADIAVDVELDEGGIPVRVMLRGSVTQQQQKALSQIIETDLGVGKEAQQWIS